MIFLQVRQVLISTSPTMVRSVGCGPIRTFECLWERAVSLLWGGSFVRMTRRDYAPINPTRFPNASITSKLSIWEMTTPRDILVESRKHLTQWLQLPPFCLPIRRLPLISRRRTGHLSQKDVATTFSVLRSKCGLPDATTSTSLPRKSVTP